MPIDSKAQIASDDPIEEARSLLHRFRHSWNESIASGVRIPTRILNELIDYAARLERLAPSLKALAEQEGPVRERALRYLARIEQLQGRHWDLRLRLVTRQMERIRKGLKQEADKLAALDEEIEAVLQVFTSHTTTKSDEVRWTQRLATLFQQREQQRTALSAETLLQWITVLIGARLHEQSRDGLDRRIESARKELLQLVLRYCARREEEALVIATGALPGGGGRAHALLDDSEHLLDQIISQSEQVSGEMVRSAAARKAVLAAMRVELEERLAGA